MIHSETSEKSENLLRLRSIKLPSLSAITANDWLYVLVVFSIVLWLLFAMPYLPMIDMSQHAAQIVALDDLLKNQSIWSDLVTLNFATPYLFCYFIWLLLYQVFSITIASKLIVILIFFAWIVSWKALRKAFQATKVVDWVILPSFFTLSFYWGFIPFIFSLPIGIFFFLANKKWAEKVQPSLKDSIYITVFGLFLFLTHALGYCFFCLLSYVYVAIKNKHDMKKLAKMTVPYMIFALVLFYYITHNNYYSEKEVNLYYKFIEISEKTKHLISGSYLLVGIPKYVDYRMLVFLLLPFVIMKPSKNKMRYIPIAIFILVWFSLPYAINDIFFIYERYISLFWGVYFLMFDFRDNIIKNNISLTIFSIIATFLVIGNVYIFLNQKKNSENLEKIIQRAPEKERLLFVNYFSMEGEEYFFKSINVHAGAWYQAEKHGWVDFNFARTSPVIVRYKKEKLPPITQGMEWYPKILLSALKSCDDYDLILLFDKATPEEFKQFSQVFCPNHYRLIAQKGNWALFSHYSPDSKEGADVQSKKTE